MARKMKVPRPKVLKVKPRPALLRRTKGVRFTSLPPRMGRRAK